MLHVFFICLRRYKRENEIASDSYKRYDVSVPQYLRNRPRNIVKHCMKRYISATGVNANSITRKENVFLVKSGSSDDVYEVILRNGHNFPSCSCKDFDNHFLPCKHMFAIFHTYSDVSWESLPSWYRNSAQMVLDEEVISSKNDGTKPEKINVNEDVVSKSESFLDHNLEKEDDQSHDVINSSGDCSYVEKKKVLDEINKLVSEIRNVSFDARSLQALKDAKNNLQIILQCLMKSCDYENGLRISACQSKPRKVLKVKRKSTSFPCDELPRKYAKPNPYASRVGETANKMKSFHSVTTLFPLCNISPLAKTCNTNEKEESEPTLKKYTSIVPHLASEKLSSLSEILLRNGPHSLSMIQLKSIEPVLTAGELNVLKSHDAQFTRGWLYDEIINSFLRQLCKQNHHCIYASSTITQIIENGKSIKNLWKGEFVKKKKLVFLPWNPFGTHWILLVVDITNRKLLYLDPLQLCTAPNMMMVRAQKLVNKMMVEKFSFCVKSIEAPTRFLQPDQDSCGVIVCMYAKLLATGKPLDLIPLSVTSFRKQIYEIVAGNCLKLKWNKNKCHLCHDAEKTEWIECTRCSQWMHCSCAGISPSQGQKCNNFTCPPSLHFISE